MSANTNRILIESIPRAFYCTFRDEHGVGEELDLGCLPFLLEEFIAYSATQFVIPKWSEVHYAVEYLHPGLKDKVTIIDNLNDNRWEVLWDLIREEFKIITVATEYPGDFFIEPEGKLDGDLLNSLHQLLYYIRTFSRAVDYKAQLEIDLLKFKLLINQVRLEAKNPELRLILAALHGMLETYELQEIDSLIALPNAYKENQDQLQTLLNEALYSQLSRQAHKLGIPAKLHKAKTEIQKYGRLILTQAPFKQIVDLGTSFISSSTSLPTPNSDWAAGLLKNEFLPPVITYKRAVNNAINAWKTSDHVPVARPKVHGEFLVAGKWRPTN